MHTSTLPLTHLWHEHRTRLRAYVARRVADPSAVDDILQEVFLKAHEGAHAVRQPGSITAWLYRIAGNAVADHYRARRPHVGMPDDVAAPHAEPDPIRELASCLEPLIADLPEAYRTALILSEIEGLPQKEVAARLGISLSGAKSRVQRGREKLRQRLHACCDIEIGRRGVLGFEPRDGSCDTKCT